MSTRVFVGLSGGVDSSLSCALLAEQGYDVTAVYMRNWSRDLPGFRCPWADELADAERVAVTVGCELLVWDFEEEYKKTVVDYLVDSYRRGWTPNPDVMCNQTIKFGSFAKRAFAEGADLIATGHYARLQKTQDDMAPQLLRAKDEHKDQTYFLWRVAATTFSRVLFPIGDFSSKAQVRTACAERGLGVQDKPDSDGICFVGPVGIRSFLLDSLDQRAGNIVEWETGRVLGAHDGAFLFTVGQRRGLNLGGGPARYVVATDVKANIVYVSDNPDCSALWMRELLLTDTCWVSGQPPVAGSYLVRCRHTGKLRQAEVVPDNKNAAKLVFSEPLRRVACGQSAVIYDGLICLGGGIVCGPKPVRHSA